MPMYLYFINLSFFLLLLIFTHTCTSQPKWVVCASDERACLGASLICLTRASLDKAAWHLKKLFAVREMGQMPRETHTHRYRTTTWAPQAVQQGENHQDRDALKLQVPRQSCALFLCVIAAALLKPLWLFFLWASVSLGSLEADFEMRILYASTLLGKYSQETLEGSAGST